MKNKLVHIICYAFIFISFYSFSQSKDLKGYRIEGKDVVFSFDKREYEKSKGENGQKKFLDDFDIENVIVSGNFNDWSKDKWIMTKIDENRYELRKSIDNFSDNYLWEFKFVINNAYWVEPNENDLNIVEAKENGYNLGVYNLNLFTAYSMKNGNAKFKLRGYEDASKVILSGSFNRWNEKLFLMNKTNDGWELNLQLRPGEYQYKFIIDGHWIEDVENPNKVSNEFSSYNSIIDIRKQVTFQLNGYNKANKIILSGSFNDWNENKFKMTKTDIGWECTVLLSGGKHHYKFIVDNNWIIDPNNTVMEYDNEGNINSVYMVK